MASDGPAPKSLIFFIFILVINGLLALWAFQLPPPVVMDFGAIPLADIWKIKFRLTGIAI
jgi:hypothetical protein